MERQIRAIWQDGAGRNLSGLYLAAARRAHGESPGGNTGAGPGGGAGFAAYVRCNTFALKCNCRDCGDK